MKSFSNAKVNLLRQNARSVVRELGLLNNAYFEIGVTLAERHLLIELFSSTTFLTAVDIAERLLLDKSTVSRLVARAVKKGFVVCSSDKQDKRKRLLQLTDLGKRTLAAFESIAFKQTSHALQTLSYEECNCVCQGVALYAKGLKSSRLQNTGITFLDKKIDNLKEIHNQLYQLGYKIETYQLEDEEALFAIFKEVIDAGDQFPYRNSSKEEFQIQFFDPPSQVYVCRSFTGQLVGGFYLKPNYSGRAEHIANAAYMIKSTHRKQGIGTLLIKASLQMARKLGFLAMQYNLVLSQNTTAITLYEKLGFETIGTIPRAVRNANGSWQDAYIMYRRIDNLTKGDCYD